MARISTRNLLDGGGPENRNVPKTTPTTTPAVTSSTPAANSTNDSYYVRDPKTGLSQAQVDARKELESLAGPDTKLVTPPGSAGRLIPKPQVPPNDDKFSYDYVWVGATTGSNIGSWKLIKKALPVSGSNVSYSGSGFSSGGSTGGGSSDTGSAKSDAMVDFQKAQAAAAQTAQRESAFSILKKEFDKYGLGTLADTVKNLIMAGSPVEEVVLKLRATPEYEKRFAGNKMRLASGLNVYDEATYIDLENAYDQIFTSYGVMEAAGNTVDARRAKYAEFIGGTKSPDEIKGRVQLAVAAANEDEVTKATLRQLYPEITDKDIVSYFLNPKDTLPKLETKVRSAQIGAAAVRQGLVTNVATAEELAAMGVTEQQAEQAYSAYAGMKPRLDLLSSLEKDNELMVNQQVAEGALFKNLASEQRKLEMLRQKEIGRFSGSAGTSRGVSLSREAGGLI
jgi:hypothetical protein